MDKKGKKIKEVDFYGRQIGPYGKKNKNILKSFVMWAEFTNQQENLRGILTEDYRRTEVILEWKKIVDKKE